MQVLSDISVGLSGLLVIALGIEIYTRYKNGKEYTEFLHNKDGHATEISKVSKPVQVTTAEKETESNYSLSSDDLMAEADIYLLYGHYAQAAVVLRWYVDMNPHDTGAIQKLLKTYEAMSDINAYAQLLESLGTHLEGSEMQSPWWKQQILNGLRYDPGNLELLVLADKAGISVPIPDSDDSLVDLTPEKALAIVSRSNDPVYCIALLQKAILVNPKKLALYAEALRLTSQHKMLDKYVDILVILYITVGYSGKSLRERMLQAGRAIGDHALWDVLDKWDGNPQTLIHLAASRGIKISDSMLEVK
jgi:tetratricopeptide (TPR) repeat protein